MPSIPPRMTGLSLVALRNDEPSSAPDLSPVHALLDLLTEGSSLTPHLREAEAILLVSELGGVAADLASRQRTRAVVRLCGQPDPWEIGLERSGRDVLISVFQGGAVPDVLVFERRLRGELFVERIQETLRALAPSSSYAMPSNTDGIEPGKAGERGEALEDDDAAAGPALDRGSADARLELIWERLSLARPFGDGAPVEAEAVTVEPTGELPIVIAADALLRPQPPPMGPPPSVLRSDLFALLFRGRVKVAVGDHVRELPEEVFVFLVAEQLARLTLEAVEAWTRGRPYYRRLTVGGAICGVKLVREGAASLTLGVPRRGQSSRADIWTFPAVDVGALGQGVVAFGRALLRSLIRRDRAQASNLRLHGFRGTLRELSERLRDATRNDSKINVAPESYRAFAVASRARAASATFGRTRLLFTSRWVSAVPSIDLRATFLCGDRLVIGATREIACLDAKSGEPLWQRPAPRAVSVMTPLGLARLLPDGSLCLHDLGNGDIAWSARLSPRVGASASGAVVSAPGLPRMLIVSEGSRHLAAVDLDAGEVRWRFAARRDGVFRLRRAGKLVIVTSGDPTLSALDVRSGEVVWRFCDRLRFGAPVAVDHDALFAMAGDAAVVGRGGTRLYHIDPWSGVVRWGVDLPAHVAPVGAPLLGPDTVVLATHGRRGTGLVGLDRRTGELRFDQAVAGSAASCLMVDGTVIVNSEGGELVGVSASDGKTRYRHVFAGGAEGDRPRRLEPVLRSGALFVPQSEVHVVRPHDGTLLGRVPGDIIPDLLRVNERCDVYVAEESGHVAAYAAAPRLSLVRSST
jgi:outer membrane protein assembly factor BamB